MGPVNVFSFIQLSNFRDQALLVGPPGAEKTGGKASEAAGKFLKIFLTKSERCGIITSAFEYWAIAKW